MKNRINLVVLCLLLIVFSMFVCADASAFNWGGGDIFDSLSDRTAAFAKGLRNIAYIISGFGIIMFTFLAITGKINFKHLGYISISLFILAAMGALIDYITARSEAPTQLSSSFQDTYEGAGRGELCQSGICR